MKRKRELIPGQGQVLTAIERQNSAALMTVILDCTSRQYLRYKRGESGLSPERVRVIQDAAKSGEIKCPSDLLAKLSPPPPGQKARATDSNISSALSQHQRECLQIQEATLRAEEALAKAQAAQARVANLPTLSTTERLDLMRLAHSNAVHWRGLAKDTAFAVLDQQERVQDLAEDLARLQLPENLVEASYRIAHLEHSRPLEEELLQLREGLGRARWRAVEAWEAIVTELKQSASRESALTVGAR